jgi:hypothetical protein
MSGSRSERRVAPEKEHRAELALGIAPSLADIDERAIDRN